jgi:hypothetical protein
MRRIYNWTIVLGLILFISGVLIVLTVFWKNLPTSFDIVDVPGKNEISLAIMNPTSTIAVGDILKSTPEATPTVIQDENHATNIFSTPSEIPTSTPEATPTVIQDEKPALTSFPTPSETLTSTPAATPTVFPDESSAPTSFIAPSVTPTSTPATTPTVVGVESNPALSTPKSHPVGLIPDRLVISSISLDVPVIPISFKVVESEGQVYYQWLTPDQYAVGWHISSALLGLPGNTVFNGHHNAYGMPFKDLVRLEIGDVIRVYSGSLEFRYQVVANIVLPERFEPLSTRIENARWIEPSLDERITLISCWPEDSNSLRVIIVAIPLSDPG